MVGIVSYIIALLVRKHKKSLMIAMEECVADIFLGWKQIKFFYVLGSFGHSFSRNVSK